MRKLMMSIAIAMAGTATMAQAEFSKVENLEEFLSIISNKELRRPLIQLEVSEDGAISGKGAGWPVTGNWTWQDEYFCRDLFWGGDPLGYNCQRVDVRNDGRIRFTSDRGAGDSAEFRLR